MANWREFLRFVSPDCPGCAKQVMLNAVRDAAIEFCELSRVWIQDSLKSDIVAGEPVYTFAPPEGAKVVTVEYAQLDGSRISPCTHRNLNDWYPNWRSMEEDRPQMYFMDSTDSIRLVGIPKEDIPGGLLVDVALKPSRDASDCEDFLFEDWGETIASGARSRLLSTPDKPWSNPSLSNFHHRKFRQGVTTARARAYKSGITFSNTVKPQPFGGI